MQTTAAPFALTKPLLLGVSQWFTSVFTLQSQQASAAEHRVDNIRALQRMARDMEQTQPNLAAELRNFAARS